MFLSLVHLYFIIWIIRLLEIECLSRVWFKSTFKAILTISLSTCNFKGWKYLVLQTHSITQLLNDIAWKDSVYRFWQILNTYYLCKCMSFNRIYHKKVTNHLNHSIIVPITNGIVQKVSFLFVIQYEEMNPKFTNYSKNISRTS